MGLQFDIDSDTTSVVTIGHVAYGAYNLRKYQCYVVSMEVTSTTGLLKLPSTGQVTCPVANCNVLKSSST